MHRLGYCFSLLILLASATAATAQAKPNFTAEQIIERFSGDGQGSLGAARGLGGGRGVCVGTEAECKGSLPSGPQTSAAVRPSFDLMITFGLDSDRLTPPARRNLDEFARALQDPRLKVSSFAVEGHTDARGTDEYNTDLSRRRAEAVVKYLEARGIEPQRIQPKAFGSTQPRVQDPLDASNRRVETRISQ